MGASPSILDPRSIILLAGVMGVMMALVVFFMQRSYPRSIQGLGDWAKAPLVAFVSTMLFAARGYFPDFLTIVVANFVLYQACILYYAGSQKFLFGRSDTRKQLRSFFEVDRRWIALAALKALADEGTIDRAKVADAIARYGIDPSTPEPTTV